MSTFIYLTISKVKKLRISPILIFYSAFVILDYFIRNIFSDINWNMIIILINICISMFNLLYLLNKLDSNIEHYKLIKDLTYFVFFTTIICFVAISKINIVDSDRLIGVIYLLLCNHTYYVYVYSLNNRVVYPY